MKCHLKVCLLLATTMGFSYGPRWATAADAAGSVSVTGAYVRAVPSGQSNSAAFMVLQNDGTDDHALVGAGSPVAEVVELHTHIQEQGMMKMRRVERIEIPSQGEAVLRPGGLHVMLIGLKGDLMVGEPVTLTLSFDDGSKKEIQAPVQKMRMGMDMHKHAH